MGLEVAPGTVRRMYHYRDQCLLRISHAEDVGAARAVLADLDRIAADVAPDGYAAVSFASEVMDTPAGPMVMMDAKGLGVDELELVLSMLVQTAECVGLRVGTLEVPSTGRLVEDLGQMRLAVVGSLIPPSDPSTAMPPDGLPEQWFDAAAQWLREAGWEPLVVEVVAVESEIEWRSLEGYLRSAWASGFSVSCGSPATGLRSVVGKSSVYTRLAFMSAGLDWPRERFHEEADRMRDVVRRCAPQAAYAYVTPVSSLRRFGLGDYDIPKGLYPGAESRSLRYLPDVVALDAFWYQVLGPGHLQSAGRVPEARPLSGDKVELTFGEFEEWVEEVRRDPAATDPGPLRRHGRSILQGSFLTREEARVLRNARRRHT